MVVSAELEAASAWETGAALDELIQKPRNKFSFLEMRYEHVHTYIHILYILLYVNTLCRSVVPVSASVGRETLATAERPRGKNVCNKYEKCVQARISVSGVSC